LVTNYLNNPVGSDGRALWQAVLDSRGIGYIDANTLQPVANVNVWKDLTALQQDGSNQFTLLSGGLAAGALNSHLDGTTQVANQIVNLGQMWWNKTTDGSYESSAFMTGIAAGATTWHPITAVVGNVVGGLTALTL